MKKLTKIEQQLLHDILMDFIDYKNKNTVKIVEKIHDKILG